MWKRGSQYTSATLVVACVSPAVRHITETLDGAGFLP
jgi:hypothetical protein